MPKAVQTLRGLLGSMRRQYFFLYLLAGLSAVLEVVSVGLVLPLIEAATQQTRSLALPELVERIVVYLSHFSLLELSGLLLVVFALKGLLKLFAQYGNNKIVEEIRGHWMTMLFDVYTRRHYSFFVSTKHGVLMYNMFDLCQRAMFGLRQLVGLFLHGCALVLTLLFLASLSWQITLVSVLVLMAGYAAIHRPMLVRSNHLGKIVLSHYHEASALASEILRGIREVKAYGAAPRLLVRYRSQIGHMVEGSVKIALLEVIPTIMPEILLAVVLFLAVAMLERYYMGGEVTTLLPLLGTFSYGLYRIFVQGSTVARTAVAFTSHWASIDQLSRELTEQAYRDTSAGERRQVEEAENLTCDNVSFAYDDHRALSDVTLQFRRNSITAIVGDSGAGKSTLADLLIRLLTPTSGCIRYGSVNIADYTIDTWRTVAALVSQDVFLFHGTIRENITLGMVGEVSAPRLTEALQLSGAEEFVSALPQGWDTVVGERGVKLSGGQRQRIAIARALVRQPHILILDEATSALDGPTEAALLRTLQALKKHLIIIAITHRLSVAQAADSVYVLRGGHMVEAGRHQDLLEKKGIYTSLYEHTALPVA